MDDNSLISLLFPVSFSEWVASTRFYWSTLAERPSVGKFKAPTLRNIAVTGPYMQHRDTHGVLDHYAAGGRTISSGPHAGVGDKNPDKHPLVGGFELSAQDRQG